MATQKEDQKLVFKTDYCLMQVKSVARLLLNTGQKCYRMLQREHSAIFATSIKLPFVIKTFVLSIFEWLLKTGFTVVHF